MKIFAVNFYNGMPGSRKYSVLVTAKVEADAVAVALRNKKVKNETRLYRHVETIEIDWEGMLSGPDMSMKVPREALDPDYHRVKVKIGYPKSMTFTIDDQLKKPKFVHGVDEARTEILHRTLRGVQYSVAHAVEDFVVEQVEVLKNGTEVWHVGS